MPLITATQTTQKQGLVTSSPVHVPEPIQAVSVTPDKYAATFVDLTWTPRANLLTHVEGSPWVITYYSQILTKDSALSGVQIHASAVYQTYTEIQSLLVRVTNPLASSQDEQTKAMKVAGSAIMPPCIIPNEGDMFLADIGEGKTAVLRVTQTEKKSIYQESCYEISYEIDTDTEDKRAALKAKTAVSYYYYADYLRAGKNPLLTTSAFSALEQLQTLFGTCLNQYHQQFYSRNHATYWVGGQVNAIYDHYLTRHILRTFDQSDCPGLLNVTQLTDGGDRVLQATCLWDAISQQDEALLGYAFTHADLLSARYYSGEAIMHPLVYSGAEYVVYPREVPNGVDPLPTRIAAPVTLSGTLAAVTLPWTGSNASLGTAVRGTNLTLLANQTAPIIYPVTQDSAYVLSEHFYEQDNQRSVLEQMVLTHIKRQPGDVAQLVEMIKLCVTWPALERYYYVPILLTLAKYHLGV